jgi:hypothetical protein
VVAKERCPAVPIRTSSDASGVSARWVSAACLASWKGRIRSRSVMSAASSAFAELLAVAVGPEPRSGLRVSEHVVDVRLVRRRLVAAAQHVDERGRDGDETLALLTLGLDDPHRRLCEAHFAPQEPLQLVST